MFNLRIAQERTGKQITFKTSSPKLFNRICRVNDYSECGITYKAKRTLSVIDSSHNNPIIKSTDYESYIPLSSPKESIREYKNAIKVLKVENMDELLITKGILKTLKEDILNPNLSSTYLLTLFYLLTDKSLSTTITFSIAAILAQFDPDSLITLLKTKLQSEDKRSTILSDFKDSAVGELGVILPQKEDVLLYTKIPSSNIKFK